MAAKEKGRKSEKATGALRRIEGIMARRKVKVERGAHSQGLQARCARCHPAQEGLSARTANFDRTENEFSRVAENSPRTFWVAFDHSKLCLTKKTKDLMTESC